MSIEPKLPPLVSIVVLNLNGERVIGACLDHLLAQTYPNCEIIVVDNGSTDKSLEILDDYMGRGNLSVVRSPYNRGCPGGRNLGTQYAGGEFVAYIDNDGYASPGWLAAAIEPLLQDDSAGAVASVVIFNRNPAVLNGAGGTINRQGYGGDYCFFEPQEFAELPVEVLYPMGCGMVVRRKVLDEIGPWDEALPNYYDDTELGFRVWKSGYRVVVAPGAHIRHEFNYSSQFLPGRRSLIERGRIRTVLKYYPLRRLPAWLVAEFWHAAQQGPFAYYQVQAWIWNLIHLPSALRWRLKYPSGFAALSRLMHPSWGWYRFPVPTHCLYNPDPDGLGSRLLLGDDRNPQLGYGWYAAERNGTTELRWISAHASATFRLARPSDRLLITLQTRHAPQRLQLHVRRPGRGELVWEAELDGLAPGHKWITRELPCELDAGDYEVLLAPAHTAQLGARTVGIAIARLEFALIQPNQVS